MVLSVGIGISASQYVRSFLTTAHEKSIEINENTLSFKIETCLSTFLGRQMSAPALAEFRSC